jgi:hypothetical protein
MASSEIRASQRRYSNSELLLLVRQVALAASPDAPKTVSQRGFNAARSQVTGHCPEAAYLVKRLHSPWPELLSLAFADDEKLSMQTITHRELPPEADKATCVAALQLVARRLTVSTLRPAQYNEAREALLKTSRGARKRELQERLPSGNAIDRKGWDELLSLAGLTPRVREVLYTGLCIPDAIERFLEAQGFLPSLRELERFAKERGLSLAKANTTVPHVVELRSRRTKEGRWTPPGLPHHSRQPPWQSVAPGEEAPLDPNNPRRRRHYWTLARVQAGLRLAIGELQPGEALTMLVLRRLTKANRDIPNPSVAEAVAKRHGTTITALRTEALAAMRPPHPPRSEAAE